MDKQTVIHPLCTDIELSSHEKTQRTLSPLSLSERGQVGKDLELPLQDILDRTKCREKEAVTEEKVNREDFV